MRTTLRLAMRRLDDRLPAPGFGRVFGRSAVVLVATSFLFLFGSFPLMSRPGPASAAVTPEPRASTPVVLVGISGLRWSDVSATATPALWKLAGEGMTAALSVRTVYPRACPGDAWLTVNTGVRTTGLGVPAGAHRPCPPLPRPVADPAGPGASVPGFAAFGPANEPFGYAPRSGALAGALARAGMAPLAVGPGAALAVADRDGHVPTYLPDAATLDASRLAGSRFTVVDLGALPEADPAARGSAVAAADGQLARILAAVPSGSSTLVAGMADSGPVPHLHVVVASRDTPPGRSGGRLTSASTRRDGVVQIIDLTPTVLAWLGAPPVVGAVGAELRAVNGRPDQSAAAVRRLTAQDELSGLIRENLRLCLTVFGLAVLTVVIVAAVVRGPLATRVRPPLRAVLVTLGAVPVSTFLVQLLPWWQATAPVLVFALVTVGCAAGLAAAGLAVAGLAVAGLATGILTPSRTTGGALGPPGVVAAATVVVLAGDVMVGSPLQYNSMLGLSPLVAGRFYGFGNVAFAVFAMAVLFTATWGATLATGAWGWSRDRAATLVAGIGAAAVVVEGWPDFGADFGGVLALLPGIGLFALHISGRRLSVFRLVGLGATAAAVVALIAVLDWVRPETERTHLGRFMAQVLDGQAGDVLARKAETAVNSFHHPVAALVPVGLAMIGIVVLWPDRVGAHHWLRAYAALPWLRPGLLASLATTVLGVLVNDSGVVVLGAAALVTPALALAAVVGHAIVPPGSPPPAEPGQPADTPPPATLR